MKYIQIFLILFMMSLTACGENYYHAGTNGHSAAFGNTLAADVNQCSSGGTVLPYGVDTNDDGSLQTEETNGVVITCNGQKGDKGDKGNTGSAGTQATPVKLCPGTQSYPTVFVEYAFCINGQLWGVYSANNGFLTYFPPGAYSSNAVGSSCSFTITSGCNVTH